MIALLGFVLPLLSKLLPAWFGYLGKKQDVGLASVHADEDVKKAALIAQIQSEQIQAAANNWVGAKIVACTAGEAAALYYATIVLDSVFHFGWHIAKLPAPWDQYTWTILTSFIVLSPVAPILTGWTSRKS